MAFPGKRNPIPEPIAVIALPIRLRIKKASMALVNIVMALLRVPPAPDTAAKAGTLTLVVPSLIELGILKFAAPVEMTVSFGAHGTFQDLNPDLPAVALA